jgi:hypothetical protein
MAAAIDDLASQVQGLSLDTVAQKYPNVHPHVNPLDLWRVHLANVLSNISGVSSDLIYPAIAWTSTLDKGDFTIAVPALRIKGQKPDALATEWGSKASTVSLHYISSHAFLTNTSQCSGQKMTLSSRSQLSAVFSCPSL